MLVCLDTEFTNFVRPDLISIALVARDEREFYAESTDFRDLYLELAPAPCPS